jgi:hypothetical protein
MRTVMVRTVVVAVLGVVLPCIGVAEDAARDVKFDFGTTLNAVLADTLDARKNKPGDTIRARTSEDVKSGGVVIIPRGAKLVGHVTEAQPAAKGDRQARLGVEFERAELKDGSQIPLHTALYALAAPFGEASDHGLPAGGFGGGFGGGNAAVGGMVSTSSRSSSDDDTNASGLGHPREEDLKPSPGAIGGLNGNGTLYASSRGVFGLEDISLEPNTVPSAGSAVILANARTVHLSSGTRMLLSVEATSKP